MIGVSRFRIGRRASLVPPSPPGAVSGLAFEECTSQSLKCDRDFICFHLVTTCHGRIEASVNVSLVQMVLNIVK